MSNETIKLEADCAVATYNHLHHHHHNHHHHHPHQNPHLQHHHNPISHHDSIHDHHNHRVSSHEEDETGIERDYDDDDDEDNLIEADEEQENKGQNNELLPIESLTRGQIDHASFYDTNKLSDSIANEQITLVTQSNSEKFTQLEKVSAHEQQATQKDVIRLHQSRQLPPPSSPLSPSVDGSGSSEDEDLESDDEEEEDDEEDDEGADENEVDDDYAEDEGDDGEDVDEEEDDDDDDDDDGDDEDEDEDSDAIVDPVGHHQYLHPNGDIITNSSTITNDENQTASNNSNHDDEYDDVLFSNDYDDSSVALNSSTSSLLYSERMLEVTRKLVRSTERDPDRDLRKQVLLRTAIRKLPHFMEYSHYSETFDQNFRPHNNTLNDNNNSTALECLPSSQYYEHHNIHHLEQQPKSYYHSVQPNAIQMSTTSLRMLDLNDDLDAEFAVANPIDTKHHMSYESNEHTSHNDLDRQHEYANSNLYNPYSQHNSRINQIQDQTVGTQNDQRSVMHSFNQYSNINQQHTESTTNLITRHDTLGNLYQPLDAGEIVDNPGSSVDLAAFQTVQDYSRVCTAQDTYDQIDVAIPVSGKEVDVNLNKSHSISDSITGPANILQTDAPSSEIDQSSDRNEEHDHQYQPTNDCNSSTATSARHDSNEITKDLDTHDCNTVSLSHNGSLEKNDSGSNEDKSGCSESGSSSSQSSTVSDDSANPSSSHSNDSAGDINGISLLETSLNSSDYQHTSLDSGVVFFSPKANKRTSSSIGLDEEMEIDHQSEITPSDQINTGSVANQYKKLRKRELVD